MKKIVSCARPLWLAASSFVLSLQATPSHAQTTPFELQPVTVTGSGLPRTLGSEIAATSVLTRGDIERSGARDAVSVLNLLGTALVEQQGGPGTGAVVRIRGADSRDTLVLVDGVPLTDVTSGQASLSQIPAELIERVEVVRGNLSALYGA
ncbi:MAG TPA: TonB-dependent receptor plug domain-containing protein, partial [Albitalea sp.]|nr:TonB-dependent receptor plug domain-containing protein [Albitalea sp.]